MKTYYLRFDNETKKFVISEDGDERVIFVAKFDGEIVIELFFRSRTKDFFIYWADGIFTEMSSIINSLVNEGV